MLLSLQAYESNMTGIETADDNAAEVDLDHQGVRRNYDFGGGVVEVNATLTPRAGGESG